MSASLCIIGSLSCRSRCCRRRCTFTDEHASFLVVVVVGPALKPHVVDEWHYFMWQYAKKLRARLVIHTFRRATPHLTMRDIYSVTRNANDVVYAATTRVPTITMPNTRPKDHVYRAATLESLEELLVQILKENSVLGAELQALEKAIKTSVLQSTGQVHSSDVPSSSTFAESMGSTYKV